MLVGAGVMTILLSSEICWRYYKANKRELDPELDNLTNPQVGSGTSPGDTDVITIVRR